jgi:predicted secreted acid phosphatase
VRPPGPSGKPAIVLDIDETALSNYAGLLASGFSATGTAVPAATGTGTAIGPVLDLYRDARNRGVAVFFITGRPSAIKSISETNLKRVGYDRGWEGTFFKPSGEHTEAFKAGTRADIEKQGFDILVNVGDQESDLDGGSADRAFKLPNPFYYIPD